MNSFLYDRDLLHERVIPYQPILSQYLPLYLSPFLMLPVNQQRPEKCQINTTDGIYLYQTLYKQLLKYKASKQVVKVATKTTTKHSPRQASTNSKASLRL